MHNIDNVHVNFESLKEYTYIVAILPELNLVKRRKINVLPLNWLRWVI